MRCVKLQSLIQSHMQPYGTVHVLGSREQRYESGQSISQSLLLRLVLAHLQECGVELVPILSPLWKDTQLDCHHTTTTCAEEK